MITGITPEGIRYAVRRAGAAVGYCALTIGCGTRDEGSFPSGIAHFTEHAIFKGTAHRSARSINSCLELLGGELNAFTTKEETVIHATVLKEDLSRALKLLVELATEPSFPEDEIEIEKGVVVEEIQSYKDSPADDVYDCFEELFFKGHPLSGPILGTEESVQGITVQQLKDYTAGGFTPDRMVLSMVADLPEDRMVAMLHRASARLQPVVGSVSFTTTVPSDISLATGWSERGGFDKVVKKDNHEANAVFGGYAPSLADGRPRLVAGLLSNILAGPASNSVLGSVLRERNGWVYGVEASYTPYKETGIMAISLGCDPSNLSKVTRAVRRELSRMCEAPMAPRTFAAAKKQLLGQMAVSTANGESQCLGLGKSMLAFGRVLEDQVVRQEILSITAEEVRAAAEAIFAPGKYSSLVFI
ncbi:MAG: insulinase family protein [Bacteroidales bacterium]|nr:insulinase family protein [Bacteroidales bacterium]